MSHLIQLGLLPHRLGKVKPPPCLSCLLGKSKREPWRSKGIPGTIRPIRATPGSLISVDQLASSVPGIKPQSTGRLASAQIVGAQVFANSASSPPFLCTHLLESFPLDDTLKAKVGFERMAATFDIIVIRYRADNGRFSDNGFLKTCTAFHQTINFCGVNAHF